MFVDPKINSALYLNYILLFNMFNISVSSPKNSAYISSCCMRHDYSNLPTYIILDLGSLPRHPVY